MRWLLKLWRLLPPPLQTAGIKAVQRRPRLYRWVLFRHVDAKDRANGVSSNLPPAELRYRVSSTPDADEFVRVGKRCAEDIQNALSSVGRGFVFQRSYEEGLFPAWYQNAYHSREYVVENFGKYFEVVDYFVRAMNAHQDVVVLRKN